MIDEKIAILSSCRLGAMVQDSYIHEVHHTHNTEEAIQYIRYINGDIDIEEAMHRYVFRSCYLDNGTRVDRDKLRQEWDSIGTVCIEICSRKKYTKNGYAIHHLAADKGDAPGSKGAEANVSTDEFELEIQSEEAIEQGILRLLELLGSRRAVFITHTNPGIQKRSELIDQITEICRKHSLLCINPSDHLAVLEKEMTDANHFTPDGQKLLADFISQEIANRPDTLRQPG